MEVYLGTILPGGASQGLAVHAGEEFVFVLQGEIEYEVGGSVYHLREGDMLYYASDLPHGYRNKGADVVRVLWGETK